MSSPNRRGVENWNGGGVLSLTKGWTTPGGLTNEQGPRAGSMRFLSLGLRAAANLFLIPDRSARALPMTTPTKGALTCP